MHWVKAGAIACRRKPRRTCGALQASPSSGHILGEIVKTCEVACRIMPKKDLQ